MAAPRAIAGMTLAAALWLGVLAPPPTPVTFVERPGGGFVVETVQVSSAAFAAGVRPRDPVLDSEPADLRSAGGRGTWQRVSVGTDAGAVTLPPRVAPAGPVSVGVAVGAALVGIVAALRRMGETSALATVVAAAASSAILLDRIAGPAALASFLAGPSVAALYAADARRRLSWRVPIAAGALVAAIGAAWLIGRLDGEWWPVTVALWAVGTIALTQAGIAGALRPLAARLRHRLADERSLRRVGPAETVGIVVDELVPGRSGARRAAAEAERARVASSIHADLLPDLAGALRNLEGAAPDPAAAARRLREATAALRELMAEQRLPVLDELGIVAALEWLAERTEDRDHVTVDLEIADDPSRRGASLRPPRQIELAAFRVARLAVDNAVRHARPRSIGIRVATRPDGLALAVGDDGAGIDPDARSAAVAAGHRGLADMQTAADAVGAELRIADRPGGGTLVAFMWRAR